MSFGHVSMSSNIELRCAEFLRAVAAKQGRRKGTRTSCQLCTPNSAAWGAELTADLARKVGTILSFHPTYFTLYKYILISGSKTSSFDSKNPKLQREIFERKSN